MNKFKYDICIFGGLGHVGLPLGIAFADKKFKVVLYDKNEDYHKKVASLKMPFVEYGAQQLLKKNLNQNLFLSKNYEDIFLCKNIIITIGTPIDEYLNPKLSQFIQIIKKLSNKLDKDQNIIIRSSVYPGTMEIINRILQKNKIKNLSYCPERIVQGYAIKELNELPQIISTFNKQSEKKARKIFAKITKKIIKLSIKEAELVKLISNSWRYIQFASANQFYMICYENNVNFDNVRKAMIDSYPRGEGLPGAGFTAGPCLLKDTMQLYAFSKNIFSIGNVSMFINEGLPNFVINKLKAKYDLTKKKIGILGMAFKANIDDKRDSLSYKLCNLLKYEAKKVYCSDEYIKDINFLDKEMLIRKSDIIILATPHNSYKKLKINKQKKIIIDVWSFLK